MRLQPTDYTIIIEDGVTAPAQPELGIAATTYIPSVLVTLPECDRRFAKKVMRSVARQLRVKYSDLIKSQGFKELR